MIIKLKENYYVLKIFITIFKILNFKFQRFGVNRYKKNVIRTDRGFTFVLGHLFPNFSNTQTTGTDKIISLEERRQR